MDEIKLGDTVVCEISDKPCVCVGQEYIVFSNGDYLGVRCSQYDEQGLHGLHWYGEVFTKVRSSLGPSSVIEFPDKENQLYDITGEDDITIQIKQDGKILWMNNKYGCFLRIGQIRGKITIKDDRPKE